MSSLADDLWEQAGAPLAKEMFGAAVVLERNGRQSDVDLAIADAVEYQISDASGFTTSVTVWDYTIDVADYTFDGETVRPRAGDKIIRTVNDVDQIYEAMPLADKHVANLLPGGMRWLVHTKQVA